ncbi:MAG TPA: hypothetical protein VM577_08220 [Anaerovoracaceae bacterium]|nr:hypothetical protein [Anaerovoracaceae bacterium]
MNPELLGKFFLQYYSAINGGIIYFAGEFGGPWTRDLEKAKGYVTQGWAEKAKERLALKKDVYWPVRPDDIQIVRVVARPVIEVLIGTTWSSTHPSRWT